MLLIGKDGDFNFNLVRRYKGKSNAILLCFQKIPIEIEVFYNTAVFALIRYCPMLIYFLNLNHPVTSWSWVGLQTYILKKPCLHYDRYC